MEQRFVARATVNFEKEKQMAPSQAGYARPAMATDQIGAGQLKRTGSLADACSELNSEVDGLELAMKGLHERTAPFLERAPTEGKTPPPNAPTPVVSPLAESIFEYVARIRQTRIAVEELTNRIAY